MEGSCRLGSKETLARGSDGFLMCRKLLWACPPQEQQLGGSITFAAPSASADRVESYALFLAPGAKAEGIPTPLSALNFRRSFQDLGGGRDFWERPVPEAQLQ